MALGIPLEVGDHVNVDPVSLIRDIKEPLRTARTLAVTTTVAALLV